MAKLTAEVRLSDSADWRELLTVMAQHLDELPAPVRQGLEALSNGEALVWGWEWVVQQGADPWHAVVIADGMAVERVKYVLPFRRGYQVQGGEFVPAASLSIMHKGKVLAGW